MEVTIIMNDHSQHQFFEVTLLRAKKDEGVLYIDGKVKTSLTKELIQTFDKILLSQINTISVFML